MRYTAFCTAVLMLTAMMVMLKFASSKTIVIAEEVTAGSGAEQEYVEKKQESISLDLLENTEYAPSIRIPLPKEVRPDDIIIENHYLEQRINVIVAGARPDYYDTKRIEGEIGKIQGAACYEGDNGVVLSFRMNGLYEHKYLLEENALYLEFQPPHEVYGKIIVLDAGHGGRDSGVQAHGLTEKEITLGVVEGVRKRLEDSGVRVYCTRQQDTGISLEQRAAFINELRPDMVISVHMNASEEQKVYGTEVWYHAGYVIPVFGNVELADTLERSVVTAADGKALGLRDIGAEEVLADTEEAVFLSALRVPAAVLEAGYLTNGRESSLLSYPAYQDRIAEGICEAIEEAYRQMERHG